MGLLVLLWQCLGSLMWVLLSFFGGIMVSDPSSAALRVHLMAVGSSPGPCGVAITSDARHVETGTPEQPRLMI